MLQNYNRRVFLKKIGKSAIALYLTGLTAQSCRKGAPKRPNILIFMADNMYGEHLGCYGDEVVKTPNIDKLARHGLRFENAFCCSPSCTPSRAGLLTGQDPWRLGETANLWSRWPGDLVTYTDLLEQSGYSVGFQGKGWGPGRWEESGRKHNPAGKKYSSFLAFLEANTSKKPWGFWCETREPHRPYKLGSGVESGMDLNKVFVPPYLPDSKEVRSDICDYYYEVQRFDKFVGRTMRAINRLGDKVIKNTIIIVTSDNGWMMPRGLANLYDFGTKVPLVIYWKDHIKENRVVSDFVNLNDLAPTFLELAGLEIPDWMTAESLTNVLFASKLGRVDVNRDFVVMASERHALCRKDGVGYPNRAIRTDNYLYIRNYEPDRWPAGDPKLFGDIDAHTMNYYAATKEYMMLHKDYPEVNPLYELGFMKRPAEELFDLKKDPYQMNNVAEDKAYAEVNKGLSEKMDKYLIATDDPRAIGGEIIWDTVIFTNTNDYLITPSERAIEKFNMKREFRFLKPDSPVRLE